MVNKVMMYVKLERGDIIGDRYRVIRLIGQGGMGTVYAVEDMKLEGMLRAMKLTCSLSGDGVYSEEANTLMKLNHPYLPLITDYFSPADNGGMEAVIMDYIEGDTIASMVTQSLGGFTFPELVHVGLQLCSALIYLHEQPSPIIHRDLKPSNVMIDRKGCVKLIDFGISRRYKEGKPFDTVRLGTVGFAAPEQREGGQSDARTDIYGLGALLYYMASGGEAIDPLSKDYRALYRVQGHIPQSFRAVLERMLQPDPERRYQSMAEVERALLVYAAQSPMPEGGPRRWDAHLNGMKPSLISVISLSPGAGATMLSITLAQLLAQRGHSVTAVEYFGLAPEWLELLPSIERKSFVSSSEGVSFSDRLVHRRDVRKEINWLAVNSHRLEDREQDERLFEQHLRQFQTALTVIDFSSCWHEAGALHWLQRSKHIVVVADPFISRWQVGRLQSLIKLREQLADLGCSVHWIANKDVRFKSRNEWLKLFPERPIAAVPLLPQDALLNMLWSGRWITDNTVMDYRLSRALMPLCDIVTEGIALDVRPRKK